MKPPGIKLQVRNVIGGGDHDWACVELIADAECKNGKPSFLKQLGDSLHWRGYEELMR